MLPTFLRALGRGHGPLALRGSASEGVGKGQALVAEKASAQEPLDESLAGSVSPVSHVWHMRGR